MATQVLERRADMTRPYFPWISWGAIFGGLATGMATFILLAMLGLAAGFTAVDPGAAEPVGAAPAITGIWTGISLLLAAFVGGYVASRMSGMSRRTDGILHGFVAWGVITLTAVYLVTTSVGALLGGTFNLLGQGAQALGQAAGAAGGAVTGPGAQNQLQSLITGSPEGAQVSPEAMGSLHQQLADGNRQGAIQVMVNQMGFTQERAETMVDQAMPLYGAVQQAPQQGEEVAQTAVSGLTAASWWLFGGLLVSLVLGMVGGWVGAKATVGRRSVMAH